MAATIAATQASACAVQQRHLANTVDAAHATKRPNVLVILADQHRADCLGCFGNLDVRTPNLDRLANAGVRFTSSFCPFPVCTPSRYSLLSGLPVHEHRGYSNRCTLPPGTPTFASVLRAAGYATAAVGKMHFTPTYLDVGFDRLILAEQDGDGRWDDDYHRHLRANGLVDANDLEDQRREYRERARPQYWETFGALPSNLPREHHSTEWIASQALDILEGWTGNSNLLMVGFIKPHHPFDPPREWCDRYDPAALHLLPGWTESCLEHDIALHRGYFDHTTLSEGALRRVMAYYYATIEHLDEQVGRMIATLRRKGLYDDTLIIYTSDHGEYLGFHHLLLKGNYMYDPLIRVPLIVKFPQGHRGGTEMSGLVCNTDVAPTILRQAGLEPAPGMLGRNLAHDADGHDAVFAESGRGGQLMVRTAGAKLLRNGQTGAEFLYDFKTDPLEMRNGIADKRHAGIARELRDRLDAWRGTAPRPEPYVNLEAPVIHQVNVPAEGDAHREDMIVYYAEKMDAYLNR